MTKEEALGLLKSNVERFNELRENGEEKLDLSGVNLSGTNLEKANLRRITFAGANFQKANLSGAQLTGDNLEDVDFRGADLTDASFHHATLQGADMREVKCSPDTRRGRFCVSAASFERVSWDKSFLEEVLSILNQNKNWDIKYEIIAK